MAVPPSGFHWICRIYVDESAASSWKGTASELPGVPWIIDDFHSPDVCFAEDGNIHVGSLVLFSIVTFTHTCIHKRMRFVLTKSSEVHKAKFEKHLFSLPGYQCSGGTMEKPIAFAGRDVGFIQFIYRMASVVTSLDAITRPHRCDNSWGRSQDPIQVVGGVGTISFLNDEIPVTTINRSTLKNKLRYSAPSLLWFCFLSSVHKWLQRTFFLIQK